MHEPSIKAELTALENAAALNDETISAIGLTSLRVPENLADSLRANFTDGPAEHWSARFASHHQTAETFVESADAFVFGSALSITIEPPSTNIASVDATRHTIASPDLEAGSITATNFGHGFVAQLSDAPPMEAGPASAHSSAVLLAAVDSSSGGDTSAMMMCGCAACVAARDGDTNAFTASGDDLPTLVQPQFDIQSGPAGSDGFVAASAPSYAVSALVNEYGSKWGSYTMGAAATVTYSFLTSFPSYYGGSEPTFQPMNAAQQPAAR